MTGFRVPHDSRPRFGRRALFGLAAGALALVVAGCSSGLDRFGSGPSAGDPNLAPIQSFGSGPVRVAMLLPLTATGNAGVTGNALKNAAELAVSEIPGAQITIVPYDTGGTPQGATAAAQRAVQEGARLILGPLFASSVIAAGQVASAANVPIVAYSSDPNAAGRQVYLLSFLAQADISRIVSYAAKQNRRAIAALLPNNAYGTVVEAALMRAAGENGAQVVAIEKYAPDAFQIQEAVQRLAPVVSGPNARANALLVPDNASALPAVTGSFAANRIDVNQVQLLGSGQWDDTGVRSIPLLSGGWYPAPENGGFQGFASRYRAKFGTEPPRIATLAYDSVTLAAALARINTTSPYTEATLTNPDGFSGIDGIFRFRRDGTSERGLAVYEVSGGAPRVLEPAPRSFAGAGL